MYSNKENTAERLQKIAESRLYECIICLERVKKPVKCSTCHKVLCSDHIKKLGNKCPNCRSTPFDYYEDSTFSKLVEGIELNERSLERPHKQFECLMPACKFTGNYVSMLKHRKKVHSETTIEDMLYNEKAKLEKEKRRALLEVLKNMARHQQVQIAFFCTQNPKMPPEG
jgi:predicted nucleic acid binding AN1-type Zn finger protein